MTKIKKTLCAFAAAVSVLTGCCVFSAYAEGVTYTMGEESSGMPILRAPIQEIYANIVIPKTEGVTYYFMDPTDDYASVPGDSFEEILDYIEGGKTDNDDGQWMAKEGIKFNKDGDDYQITLTNYKGATLKIYYTIDKESGIEGLVFDSDSVSDGGGTIKIITSDDSNAEYKSFTLNVSKSGSNNTFQVKPQPVKSPLISIGDISDGITVNGLSEDGVRVSRGDSITFQAVFDPSLNVTAKIDDTVLTPTKSAEGSNEYTIYNVTENTTVDFTAEKKTYRITDATLNKSGYTIFVDNDELKEEKKINYGESATLKVQALPGYSNLVLYNGTTVVPLVGGTYTIPASNTDDWRLVVSVDSTPTITFSVEESEEFNTADNGTSYKGYLFQAKQINGGEKSFSIGIRASYMSDGKPYERYYAGGTALTLGESASIYFGVTAPSSYQLTPYTDINGALTPTSAGVVSETYDLSDAAQNE